MTNILEKKIKELNSELISMASLVEEGIFKSTQILTKKNEKFIEDVTNIERQVNLKEKEIENMALELLLTQQPVASDLRFISSTFKIITDLERISDQAEDIAEISTNLLNNSLIKDLDHIYEMSNIVIYMVNKSITSFINRDKDLAKVIIKKDDIVDDLFDIIKDELIKLINLDVNNGSQAIDLIMIAKYLERIGDHAVNICEWVLFTING